MDKTHYEFHPGDKVVKKSGKPFKSSFKTGTVRELTTHPHTGRPAVIIDEDETTVESYMLKPKNI